MHEQVYPSAWLIVLSHRQVYEALDNITPTDAYHGRIREANTVRGLTKEQIMQRRRWHDLGLMPLNEEVICT